MSHAKDVADLVAGRLQAAVYQDLFIRMQLGHSLLLLFDPIFIRYGSCLLSWLMVIKLVSLINVSIEWFEIILGEVICFDFIDRLEHADRVWVVDVVVVIFLVLGRYRVLVSSTYLIMKVHLRATDWRMVHHIIGYLVWVFIHKLAIKRHWRQSIAQVSNVMTFRASIDMMFVLAASIKIYALVIGFLPHGRHSCFLARVDVICFDRCFHIYHIVMMPLELYRWLYIWYHH